LDKNGQNDWKKMIDNPINFTSIEYYLEEILLSVVLFALCTIIFLIIENIKPLHKVKKFTKEKYSEVGLYFINTTLIIPITAYFFSIFIGSNLKIFIPFQPFNFYINTLPVFIQILFALIILDLLTYFRHRFTHSYMWKFHAIHHSSEYISWITGYRLHPVEVVLLTIFQSTVLYFIGFDGTGMAIANTLYVFANLISHANINFGWKGTLKYILVSPNFHRWHHAKYEKQSFNKNFSVMFPFIDLIFGSYYYDETALPKEYGIYQFDENKDSVVRFDLWGMLVSPFKK
jgi:sterol desaturase/sphingolipid hydroxylase (fatty acid hydroxylase superfamily)